jgi:hypothetical protein
MSRLSRILTGATAGVAALGIAAVTAAPTFAATEAWHQVIVTTSSEVSLTGGLTDNITLTPAPSDASPVTDTGDTLNVKSNVGWSLKYQAVSGGDGSSTPGTSTTGGSGTSLSTGGFAATATNNYDYAGANTLASTTGNSWGVQFALGGSGGTTGTPTALTTSGLTLVYAGTATNQATVTPTYSAATDGTSAPGTYYGVIYYKLSTP